MAGHPRVSSQVLTCAASLQSFGSYSSLVGAEESQGPGAGEISWALRRQIVQEKLYHFIHLSNQLLS